MRKTVKHIIVGLVVVVSVLTGGNLQAQRSRYNRQVIQAYPVLGATASQIRGDELKGFKKWGFTAGVGSMVSLTSDNKWKLSLEAVVTQRGSFNNTNDPYSLFYFTMNYVDIPLTLHFTDPKGGLTLGLGLIYGRLFQQPHGLIIFSPNYFMPDTSDMTFLKNDFAAALDFRFPIWRGLTFNIRYQHSIFPVKRDWMFTEHLSANPNDFDTWKNDCYNSSVSVRLLYVFGDEQSYRSGKKKKGKSYRKRRRR